MKIKLISFFIIFIFFQSCKRKVTYQFNIVNNTSKTILVNCKLYKISKAVPSNVKEKVLDFSTFTIYIDDKQTMHNDVFKGNFIIINESGDTLKQNFKKTKTDLTIITNNVSPIYKYDLLITDADFNSN